VVPVQNRPEFIHVDRDHNAALGNVRLERIVLLWRQIRQKL
jgi:hypothetical protein